MKNIKYFVFYILVLLLVLLYFYSNSKVDNNFFEEANPIREYDTINGMNYDITLNDNRNSNIKIYSSILSSIYHYKDINNINNFFVNLNINSNSNYLVENISIIDKSSKKLIKKINYNTSDDTISFDLNKNDFNNNYDIMIILKKRYL